MIAKARFACFIATTAVLATLTAVVGRSDEDIDFDALLEKERPAVEFRQKRIAKELASLLRASLKDDDWAKEWAGTYYTGDGLGMNVAIAVAPKSGIAYTWHGCLGLYDANHGEIVETAPDSLMIKWAIDPKKSQFGFLSSKLYFVRWGQRRYLVPEGRMRSLASQYNRGGWARDGLWGNPLRHEGRDERNSERTTPSPAGRPQLPAEFAKLIINKPTHFTISSIKITGQKKIGDNPDLKEVQGEVELEGGRDRGLFVGTEIDCDEGERSSSIEIYRVDESKSWGKFTATLYGKTARLPTPGSKIILPGATPDAEKKSSPIE